MIAGETEADHFGLPSSNIYVDFKIFTAKSFLDNHHMLTRTWYSSALYCLEAADFMRREDIRTVQTVAILGICFNNFGDFNLNSMMLCCAIRIGQKLGMHRDNPAVPGLKQECCRRLWWTLMICEW